ncbi:pentatricopeptide repeat-containing protein [Moniliophthora roreri MCA 2997]|uniref:Pentatricopeptide repeat-containing protein n=2 Tax=Moniliophthora roreri TaxID=221103 RepID=V2XLL6_MONRO|nr:pentatricopeptide repeat-containing protein [Moniliophthora roreri MCA 2997]KAI3596758.1 pentatricopeptide repeat-containing protein [Moniliophthora roreri]
MLRAFSLGSITQVQRQRLPPQFSWRLCKYSVVGVGRVRDLPPHHRSQNGPVQEDSVREVAGVQKQEQKQKPQVLDVQKSHRKYDDTEPDMGIDQGQHYVLTRPPFITGKSWYRLPIRPLYGGKFRFGNKFLSFDPYTGKENSNGDEREALYYHLLHIIANTQDHDKAYNAYTTLLKLSHSHPSHKKQPKIPYAHLHRLLRLIVQHRPKTRSQFLCLLSVMSTIHSSGGKLQTWEWNALISHAGTGWRRARAEDWRMALDTYDDMTNGSPPGASFSPSDYASVPSPHPDENTQAPEPDLFTYNTLLSIATKTLYGRAVKRSASLLTNAGFTPDRVTYLSMMNFWIGVRKLAGVRSNLLEMRAQGFELGLDGVNECIWGYSQCGRLDIVRKIYDALRTNVVGDSVSGEEQEVLENEGIHIPSEMVPNEVTYTATIQSMAYHGDLDSALRIFMDMLHSDNTEFAAPMVAKGEYGKYAPTSAVFRALFLGFARHGHADREGEGWSLRNLEGIYGTFIGLEEAIGLSQWTVYWVLGAFDKCSGHDVLMLRRIWKELEEREQSFGGPQNRLRALREVVFQEDMEEAKRYLEEVGFRVRGHQWGNVSW